MRSTGNSPEAPDDARVPGNVRRSIPSRRRSSSSGSGRRTRRRRARRGTSGSARTPHSTQRSGSASVPPSPSPWPAAMANGARPPRARSPACWCSTSSRATSIATRRRPSPAMRARWPPRRTPSSAAWIARWSPSAGGFSTCRSSTPRIRDAQRRSLALFGALAEDTGLAAPLEWAQKHADVIARFGRYPHRNAILGRDVDAGGSRVSQPARFPLLAAPPPPRIPRMTAAPTPIAMLGGTFDPVHYGHLRFADDVRRALGLGRSAAGPRGRSAAPRPARRRRPPIAWRCCGSPSRNFPDWPWTTANCAVPARATRCSRSRNCAREFPDSPLLAAAGRGRVSRAALLAPVARTVRPRAFRRRRAARRGPRGRPARAAACRSGARGWSTIRAILISRPAGAIFVQPIAPVDVSATVIRDAVAHEGNAGDEMARFAPARRFGLY